MRYLLNMLLLTALLAGLGLNLTVPVAAQTFTTLHSFNAAAYTGVTSTNSDGAFPGQLLRSGNTLFGMTEAGSTNGDGTLFSINTDGTSFTILYAFTAEATNALGHYTNSDGTMPYGGLILAGNTLYGTANQGGTNGSGLVFALDTHGSNYVILHCFSAEAAIAPNQYTNSDGIYPGGLLLSGSTLYGTTSQGGTNGVGTLYAMNTNGMGFIILHTFPAIAAPAYTNGDGAEPSAGLILSGAVLYGTAHDGGADAEGTVFAVNTNGTGFVTLHHFAAQASSGLAYTNSDGAVPNGGLILASDTLYGTAFEGGTNGYGTVFSITTNGTAFTLLHTFSSASGFQFTNSDGVNPNGGLVLSGSTLYGTSSYGGTNGFGTLFAVNTDGGGFSALHTFSATVSPAATNNDGARPFAGVILSGSTLYGTAFQGGTHGAGAVFRLAYPPPALAIQGFTSYVVLTWPTTNIDGFDLSGFMLQSSTNLVSPSSWTPDPAALGVVNGLITVTNYLSEPQKLFRLSD
ncbi:MAG: choice-of-anchor tandem repeat GloVer-containing protein [Verrucomicrobiota bacterium]